MFNSRGISFFRHDKKKFYEGCVAKDGAGRCVEWRRYVWEILAR